MNRVLTAIGDIHLPMARARLRMSVGVHTGTFELFLTGDDHVSVVMTGRDTSRVLALQGAANPGQILVSDETAAQLPPKQSAPDPGTPGANRLLRAGSIATASLMALTVGRGRTAERFLPRAFAQRPDLLDAEPDHRWAAIGFVQVSGVPGEPDRNDLGHMDELTRRVESAVADTGATLLDIDPSPEGYRYFLTAGAPTTVEDPEGRLLTAVQRIVTTESPYSLRAGVASGRVFAGFVGATYRQTYTVMGDSTNLAARLTHRAEPGTVLVARSALTRSATLFDAEDGGELTLKGKTRAVAVAVVTSPGRRPSEDPELPFVGRERELAILVALRTGAADGFGGALTIAGGPGAGKSRLIDRSLAETTMRIVRADGDRYAAATPYLTLQTLLRPLLDIAPDASAPDAGTALEQAILRRAPALLPWVPLIAPAVGADVAPTDAVDALDESFRQDRAHAVLRRLMAEVLPTPTCVVIDDAHWVDPASAAALAHIFGGDTSHAVYLARRPVEGGLEIAGRALALDPLPDDAAADLVDALVGHALLPSDLAPLISRAEGNPLYLIELAAGISAGSETLGIEQLIGERIDGLSETERGVIRRAAVLGYGVPLSLFVRCVGPVELAETEGVAGFLEMLDDTVRFRSELFRDVAYEQLNFQARRELHRAVAAAVIAEPELYGTAADAMLVIHHEAVGDWVSAMAAAERTGTAAERTFAMEEAVRAYRVAVGAAGHLKPAPAELADLWLSLARAAVATGRATEALDAYAKARGIIKDAVSRARIDRDRAYALNVLGRPDDAARALATARRTAAGAGEPARGILASIAVTEAGLRLRQGRWADARSLADEAIALLTGLAMNLEDTRQLGDAYRYLDIAIGELEGDDAMTHLPRALELYDEVGDELSKSKVFNVLGARAYYRGEWSVAAEHYARAQDAAERAGDVVGAAIESSNAVEIIIDQGRIDEARPLIKAALRIFSGSDNPYLTAYLTGFSGRADLRAGDPAAARVAFGAAAATFESLEEIEAVHDVRVRAIEAELHNGEVDAARLGAAAIEPDILHGPPRSQLLRHLARIAQLDGDLGRAAELARSAIEAAGPLPLERARALALLAAVTDDSALRDDARGVLTDLGVIDIDALLEFPPASSASAGIDERKTN
jgi:class 3 adenylate cyclase/tetratricopeptide (TPR) repeat protein